jgi:hypothetical protein
MNQRLQDWERELEDLARQYNAASARIIERAMITLLMTLSSGFPERSVDRIGPRAIEL